MYGNIDISNCYTKDFAVLDPLLTRGYFSNLDDVIVLQVLSIVWAFMCTFFCQCVQVFCFLRAVLKQCIPAQLWGSMENFKAFCNRILFYCELLVHCIDLLACCG